MSNSYQNNDSGSVATIGGALTNNANLAIGNVNMGASTTVYASTLSNNGSLTVQGNASSGSTDLASLILSGAAALTSTGVVRVGGDGVIRYGSGNIATVAGGSWLELDGAGARILTSGGSASALAKLGTNNGTLLLRGNTSLGAGGARLTTTTGLTNNGTFEIDSNQSFDSGSVATIGGTLTNNNTVAIGNTNMGASTTVSASALSNNGSLTVQGNASSGATSQASLILSGAAALTSTDFVRVGGDGLIRYGSGNIATVGGGSWLELDGAEARILTNGGSASALAKLGTNNGTLLLRGNTSLGAGGARLATTTSLTNNGTMYVDSYQSFDSGSVATIGGTLTNNNTLSIGNTNMGASTTISASTLSNFGSLTVQGNASSGVTFQASLVLSGAAASTSTGYVRVSGDGLIRYGSGVIATVAAGSSLELDGSEARILTSGNASALAKLATNDGTLLLRGNTSLGAGGVGLATTSGMANYGTLDVDSFSSFDSGSSLRIGGLLANEGALNIGNSSMGAATTVTVASLSNDGAISLLGSSTFVAELLVNGAATTDGSLSIGAGSKLDVTGANSFTQAGGSTTVAGSLVASTIYANQGLLNFEGAITSGDGVGALNIGAQGNLELGASVDSTHVVDFLSGLGGTLLLGEATAFSGKIAGFASHDAIDLLGQAIAGLSFSGGVLAVSLSGGGTENLHLTGSYVTSSFTFASDGHGGTNILHT